jgi:hypothetical protein
MKLKKRQRQKAKEQSEKKPKITDDEVERRFKEHFKQNK